MSERIVVDLPETCIPCRYGVHRECEGEAVCSCPHLRELGTDQNLHHNSAQ